MNQYIVVDDLFERYAVILDVIDRTTSVYCDSCEEWVAEFTGEQITQNTRIDLFEMIITAHDEFTHGVLIEFDNPKELSTWRND